MAVALGGLGVLAKQFLRPSVCCVSARFKHNHPYEAPEWKHLGMREDYRGWTKFIVHPDKDRFDYYNEIVWPPHHEERGKPKKGEHFFVRERVKHSPYKIWFACHLIRNRSVDEAYKQLEYFNRKAAILLRECLLEAQDEAVKQNKIEFRSNMWVAEAFTRKSMILKGVRRHARNRWGILNYPYSDIFLRLEEGQPPAEHRSRWPTFGGWNSMEDYIKQLRDRRISYPL